LLQAAGLHKEGTPWVDPAVKPIPPQGPLAEQAVTENETAAKTGGDVVAQVKTMLEKSRKG
jgi:hypothetical protein